jgi:Lon protease-like protein
MGWFDYARSAEGASIEVINIALFPLNTVLFPGSILPLRLFEQRYLDMAAHCMKTSEPFGICLIDEGSETGGAAQPHPVGTLAEIIDWEMEQLGILQISAQGGKRFRILSLEPGPNKSLSAKVEIIPHNGPCALPTDKERILLLLQRIIRDLGNDRIPEPHRLDDAEWVSYRISEILPIQNLAKQKLLELEDPVVRLNILEKYLLQRKLLA